MKPIEETNRERLRLLVSEFGSQVALAKKLGRSPAQLSQWITAARDSKTGKPRAMGRETARYIEKMTGKPDGWMDTPIDESVNPNDFLPEQDCQIDRQRRLLELLNTRYSGSQAAFARAISRSPAQVHQWISGHRNIGEAGARHIEMTLGLEQGWLDGNEGQSNVASAPIGERRIPLISYVQAGIWTDAADPHAMGDAFEFLLTDQELSVHAFALEIKGDSMLPEFKPGDRVIIDPDVSPQPGDYVVAKNGDNEATFKKYRPRGVNEHGNTIFELAPLNEDYPTMRSDITPIRIVGTMVEHRKYRRRS